VTRVGPWERRTRRIVYENAWIEVWHDEVVRPDGERGIYGVVHPRTTAVAIVAIDDRDRVALVTQHRYTLDERTWEIPEGGVPHDEDLAAGAARELIEETGVAARTWRELLRVTLQNSVTDERAVVFVATDLAPGPARPEATEDIELHWVSFDDAVTMVLDGSIQDSLTQVGLLGAAVERLRST